jgi:transcriptional/translational regulatory protein YebC/TACO1
MVHVSDNRNRTVAVARRLEPARGRMGESGSVGWMFALKA